MSDTTVVSMPSTAVTVVGTPGIQGPPGNVNPDQFFQTLLKFSELDDETKRTAARSNLGLQNIDGGTFN